MRFHSPAQSRRTRHKTGFREDASPATRCATMHGFSCSKQTPAVPAVAAASVKYVQTFSRIRGSASLPRRIRTRAALEVALRNCAAISGNSRGHNVPHGAGGRGPFLPPLAERPLSPRHRASSSSGGPSTGLWLRCGPCGCLQRASSGGWGGPLGSVLLPTLPSVSYVSFILGKLYVESSGAQTSLGWRRKPTHTAARRAWPPPSGAFCVSLLGSTVQERFAFCSCLPSPGAWCVVFLCV